MSQIPKLSDLRISKWPADQRVATVIEIAKAWKVTDRHVTSLIESGELLAIDIGRRFDCELVAKTALREIARRMNVSVETVTSIIRGTAARQKTERHLWRIPIEEGHHAFLRQRASVDFGT